MAFSAAKLRAGQPELVPQDGQEAVAGFTFDLVRPTVDAKRISGHAAL
jgi:hypothetical protein